MGLSSFESVHWAATAVIEAAILGLALRGKLFARLPFFTIYLYILVANEAIIWLTYSFAGVTSPASFYIYWTMQAVQVCARAAVVYEICRVLLLPYAGVWKICRPLLIIVGLALAASAAATALQRMHSISGITLTLERGLELTVVGILICGLIFCRYYGVRADRYLTWIALGLGFYSTIQVANNTFLDNGLTDANFLIWQILHEISFNIATMLWFVALWNPLPARQPAPVLLARGEYENLAPQLTVRLRELNTRLLEMWK